MYAELTGAGNTGQILQHLFPVNFSAPRTGRHGFLLFENPQHPENVALVDGPTLGSLLVETDVPVLVLNACRSAHADVEREQGATDGASDPGGAPQSTQAPADPHERVRALGSLAQEVMDAGVAGVVAMRYNVYVVTAAQFVADLYAALVRGQTLGDAVTMGRKQLAANPDRAIAYDPRPLQDWCVPVVYESMPIGLFPAREEADGPVIMIHAGDTASGRGSLDKDLPRPPDAGFFGRDETLLALDRAFDTQWVVLLHAFAGSGKTATSAEFARWYALTGGLGDGQQAVLFTSFETKKPLFQVLNTLGNAFGGGIRYQDKDGSQRPWDAITSPQERRDAVLQVLKHVPVLWIWDNVEPITGFPKGTPSAWSDAEQRELADFLRDCRSTKARFLLTSRRDEEDWLGDLPRRIKVPPMPMQERVELTRALAEKRGRRISEVADWRPLLRFTEGNPLTITVLVGQALRDGLTKIEQIDDFVAKLRAGEARFDDEASEGRTRSLGASLSYGFDHAFSEDERKQLALLHFFQGFVDVDVLKAMGDPGAEWCVPEVRGLTREAGIALLDRAAEVGLLTSHGGGYYTIHPAVPWFFKSLFDTYYAGPASSTTADHPGGLDPRASRPMRAFVEAMGGLGDYYFKGGNRDVIEMLVAEEANLLHARRLSRRNGWWRPVTSTMQGLRALYDQTGRRAEWKGLVVEIVPDFVDPATDGPRPGREGGWAFVTEYRVELARQVRDWAEAERLERLGMDWARRRAEEVVNRHSGGVALPVVTHEPQAGGSELPPAPPAEPLAFRDRLAAVLTGLSDNDRNAIRSLAASLHELGQIERERQEPGCIASYEESLDLAEWIGDHAGAASCAFNLGTAYKNIPAIRDLDQAESCYRRSLGLFDEHDRLGRAKCQYQLGAVALARFQMAKDAGEPEAALLAHLNAALQAYQEGLKLIPENAVDDRAVVHNQLGEIYRIAGDIDRALPHYRESIRYEELQGNTYGAATTRRNVAVALAQSGRFLDARDYARAARDGYASYGTAAAADLRKAEEFIEMIEKDIARKNA